MIYRDKQLSEEDIQACYQDVISRPSGQIVLTHILHEYCHFWDEIVPGTEAAYRRNFAMWLLKQFGIIREDSLIDLTQRLLARNEAEQLREGEKDA